MDRRVIVALDGIDKAAALKLAAELSDLCWGFKVNDLLLEFGTSVITELRSFGRVFADPKLHDIPNTVANGVRRLVSAGADLITVHASGGGDMIAAARAAAGSAEILAVTALTSLRESDTTEIYGRTPSDAVVELASLAAAAGAHGIVCSPEELSQVAKHGELKDLKRVVPGIRPGWHGTPDDQARTATPQAAVAAGANLLVIGRPITASASPRDAVKRIRVELGEER